MSDVFNMIGSGGKLSNEDAVLRVTVPTGSTVTMTKGGISFAAMTWKRAYDDSNDTAIFIIPPNLFDSQNAWTVTSRLGTKNSSGTIIINSNKRYNMTLSYIYVLYDYSTDSISTLKSKLSGNTGSLASRNNHMIFETYNRTVADAAGNPVPLGTNEFVVFKEQIDFSIYASLILTGYCDYSTGHYFGVSKSTSDPNNSSNYYARKAPAYNGSMVTNTLSLSSVTGKGYVYLFNQLAPANSYRRIYFTKIELRQ